jgi:hypothetical protein
VDSPELWKPMNYGFQDIRGDNIVDLSVLYDDPLKSSLDVTVMLLWLISGSSQLIVSSPCFS